MAIINIPIPESGLSVEDLANLLAQVIKEIQWLVNGNLDVNNVRANSITADRMKVSQLSAIAADLGKVIAGTLIGAYISTADGTFPRIDFSSANDLLAAYSDANNYVKFVPVANTTPGLAWYAANALVAYLEHVAGSGMLFGTFGAGEGITLGPAGDVNLNPSGNATVPAWNKLKELQFGHTLQQDLDAKQDKINGASGTINYVKDVVGSTVFYGTITVSNGIIQNFT